MLKRSLFLLLLVSAGLVQAQDDDAEALRAQAVQAVIAKVAPAVVQIETSGGADMIVNEKGKPTIRKGHGPTTGVVVGADGYVITSSFNFVNKPTDIFVAVPGKPQRALAKVVAKDTTRMLTLLKIDAQGLPILTPAPKAEVKIGQTVFALGRAYDTVDKTPNLSIGIVSAVNRLWGKAVQTDVKSSPANYGGPLLDLAGRVVGVMIPASPNGEEEISGVDYYDSGLAFAVPFEDVLAALPRLKQGKDLKKGVLGTEPQPVMNNGQPLLDARGKPVIDIYGFPYKVGKVEVGSAAEKAGLKVGDEIKEIDGKPTANPAFVNHLIYPKYEGDTVTVKVDRGGETVELKNVVLGGTADVTAQGFLGVLPMRDDAEPGVEIRYVYPKSPADTAGLKVGDRILKVSGEWAPLKPANHPPGTPVPLRPVGNANQLLAMMGGAGAGQELKLEVKRKDGGKTDTVTAKLGPLPEEVPATLPKEASRKKALEAKGPAAPKPDEDKKPETGLVEKKNAAGDRTFYVYVPKDYDPNVSYALVLWLHPINKNKKDDVKDFTDTWADYCADQHLIIVAPTTDNQAGWVGGDAEFVQEAVQSALGDYTVDRRRTVAHGMGVGGQLAFYLGFQARDTFRGVATSGAGLTGQAKAKQANQPLSFYLIGGSKDPIVKLIGETKTKLSEAKYPVIFKEIPNMGHQYSDEKTLEELVRLIDSLDRI